MASPVICVPDYNQFVETLFGYHFETCGCKLTDEDAAPCRQSLWPCRKVRSLQQSQRGSSTSGTWVFSLLSRIICQEKLAKGEGRSSWNDRHSSPSRNKTGDTGHWTLMSRSLCYAFRRASRLYMSQYCIVFHMSSLRLTSSIDFCFSPRSMFTKEC